jgi:hypothetical protein
MSPPTALASGSFGGAHPSVRSRRFDQAVVISIAAVVPFLVALAVSVTTPKPNFTLTFGVVLGILGVIALASISRLEVSVTLLALYLGMVDGPVKLLSASQAGSAVRDILIFAVSIGALLRLVSKRERLTAPPLAAWVAAFVGLVVIEAFNPKTAGVIKIVGGYRQNLEWVPFFFFGYALIRSKERFRKMFIILGTLALVNGIVSTYQTKISVASLAGWGPGYSEKINGGGEEGGGVSARKYISEGVARVRPPGLGGDSGFGGAVGILALTGTLALMATAGKKRRWYAIVMCLGSLVAVLIGLSRLELVGAVIDVVAFIGLSLSAGERVLRPLRALAVIAVLALPLGAIYVSSVGAGVFSRYESIEPNKIVQTSTTYKEKALALIPHYISQDPFGFGLATAGPAAGFGGKTAGLLEGHGITAETQYNFTEDELGGPGLVLWVALSLQILFLVFTRLPRIEDVDIRICLAAVFSIFIAHTIMGIRGAYMTSGASGAFFWFQIGIAAYWFCGPGRPGRAKGRALANKVKKGPPEALVGVGAR